MRSFMTFFLLASSLYLPKAFAKQKHHLPHAIIPCQRVFVTGHQLTAIRWADKHLFKKTCMAPQADPSRASAILVLEPIPGITPGYNATPEESGGSGYWVDCYGYGGTVSCKDSEGHEETTQCFEDSGGGVYCDSYSGPGLIEALGKTLVDLTLRNVAAPYLYDAKTHRLLWSYNGNDPWWAALAYASECKGKYEWDFGVKGPISWNCNKRKLPVGLLGKK